MILSKLSKSKRIKCEKCDNSYQSSIMHTHHITYNPEKIVCLCKFCHGYITSLDNYSRKYYKKIFRKNIIRNSELDNILRELIWIHFIQDANLNNFSKLKRKLFIKIILNRFIN